MPSAEHQTLRLLPFHLGQQVFCVEMSRLRGIERNDQLQLNPAGDPFGWLLSHDEIPVTNAARVLLDQSPETSDGRVLVFETPEQRWAVLVDGVERAFEVDSSQVQPLPPALGNVNRHFDGIVVGDDDNLRLLVSSAAFLSDGDGESEADARSSAGHSRPEVLAGPQNADAPFEASLGRLLSFATGTATFPPVRYGLSLRQVAEIFPLPALLTVPRAPAWLLGLMSWRQRAIPVVDLDRRLAVKSASARDRLLVAWTGEGNQALALLTGQDVRILSPPYEDQPCQSELAFDRSLTRGVFELSEGPLVIPDLRRIAAADPPG